MPSGGQGAPTFVTNANELVAKFNRMADRIEDPRGLLEQCRQVIQEQERDVWASDGAALEGAWKAIVEPQRKRNPETLVASGRLKDSMAGGSAGTIRGKTLRFHPKPFYGRFHQFGTVHFDARPYSGISDNTYRTILRLFEEATGETLGV